MLGMSCKIQPQASMYMLSPVVYAAHSTHLYCEPNAEIVGKVMTTIWLCMCMFTMPQAPRGSSSLGLWPCWNCFTRHHQQQMLIISWQLQGQTTAYAKLTTVLHAQINNQLHEQSKNPQQASVCLWNSTPARREAALTRGRVVCGAQPAQVAQLLLSSTKQRALAPLVIKAQQPLKQRQLLMRV
jgi:hypothetical protein